MKYRLGIDLGGTKIAAGVIGEGRELLASRTLATRAERPFEEIVADMARAGLEALAEAGAGPGDVAEVGVGAPGAIDLRTQRIIYSGNLGWRDRDVRAEFRKRWDVPVRLANDADCAVCAEAAVGAARGYSCCVMLTLGTGIGGGMIVDGRLFAGGDGYGCEPGHITVEAGGERCACGRRGCLEAYASALALERMTREAIALHPNSAMAAGEVSARTAFDAARAGDAAALAVRREYVYYLAVGIASLVTLLRPQAVVLGGGIANEGEFLLGPLREEVRSMLYLTDELGTPPILRAELGPRAGMIGAALLGEFAADGDDEKYN